MSIIRKFPPLAFSLACGILITLAAMPTTVFAGWHDITDQIIVNKGRPLLNYVTRSWSANVSVTNASGGDLPEALRLWVTANKEILNPDGSKDATGEKFFIIADRPSLLEYGHTTDSVRIDFALGTRVPLVYDVVMVEKNDDDVGEGGSGTQLGSIFRKNISKTPEWGESNQKLEVMPVYFPGMKSDGTATYCADEVTEGVSYEEWRLNGDPEGEDCDPREYVDAGEGDATCVLTEVECREVAKPLITNYMAKVDLSEESVTTDFYADRFAYDVVAAVSRDDGKTWKRQNISRMADLSSFDLETGEPFPGTVDKPQLKVVDNKILMAWVSKYCRSGNPRYAINVCEELTIDSDGDGTFDTCEICSGSAEQGTEVCENDYTVDDDYYINDIWGVRGQQRSVDYDEVDDVAELGIGEIPYSCLWVNRGVIVTQQDLDLDKFLSLGEDDPATTDVDEGVGLGDIVWYKPERLTSGRRDAYIPVASGTRDNGFVIAWQEDPDGLRPGKGKGPGQGWSGAISNHKTDIWYSYIDMADFDTVDESFVPGGEPDEDRPGVGRPKALVPFSLPVRISDNDMLNTDTLKVELGEDGLPVIDPETGTYVPVDPLEVEHGNANGTKRYAYLAKTDSLYDYYPDELLDLCSTDDADDAVLDVLPGTDEHERWYRFLNTEGSEKTVCISADGRLIDGDVSASRPNISMQGGWVLLAYEESKGMGHTLADAHDNPVDEIINEDKGQEKPIKQDLGKNVIYHSFKFSEPDLVSAGHIVNLPALCGGLYPNYCGEDYEGTNPTCTCALGQPVPLYFDYYVDNGDGTGEWMPDATKLLQYRTEIARRTRFIVQSPNRAAAGDSNTLGVIIYKQGQEGQGRPADVFIRRIVQGGAGNPYKFENIECTKYLDESFTLPGCPTDGITGYNCNIWGEASGDRLCGGVIDTPYERRDHVNLTSADIDLAVDAGPDDDTPDDPTDDVYGTDKVLLWSQHDYNLGNESYGIADTSVCDSESCAGMYSNARSHRGFIRGDFLVTAYAFSPNWAAGRNGNDRYNFYTRRSFDGGQTWTTTPDGDGVYYCKEWRTDPDTPDEDGTGNAPPVAEGFDPECYVCAEGDPECNQGDSTAEFIPAGAFEPAHNVSEIGNNKETSSDPRVGTTPPVKPLDGRDTSLPILSFVEDEYVDNVFFVAWGTGDNQKSTGGTTITPEAAPVDAYYTRSTNYGDTFLKTPQLVNPEGGSDLAGETVWRYERLAWGDPEQGEVQLRATSDGSKMYAIYHEMIPEEGDEDEPITRWYPWEPEESHENDIWFRRVIFWPDLEPETEP